VLPRFVFQTTFTAKFAQRHLLIPVGGKPARRPVLGCDRFLLVIVFETGHYFSPAPVGSWDVELDDDAVVNERSMAAAVVMGSLKILPIWRREIAGQQYAARS